MRTSSCVAPYAIAVVVMAVFVPHGSPAQQPGPPRRQGNLEVTGVVLADGVRPTAGDTVLCALNKPGATANPRAVTDAQGRFRIVIDSAITTVPDQACFFQLWREGQYRPLAPKKFPQQLAVLIGLRVGLLPIDMTDTLVLKPD